MNFDEIEKRLQELGYEAEAHRTQGIIHDPNRADYKEGYFETYWHSSYRKIVVNKTEKDIRCGRYKTKLEAMNAVLRCIKEKEVDAKC